MAASLLVAGLCACGGADSTPREFAIAPGKVVPLSGKTPRSDASSAERFGLAVPAAGSAKLRAEAPEGWTAMPPTSMRVLNYRVGQDAECYVTLLAGDGGGELANVNRWCGQLEAPAWGKVQLDQAARIPMLGGEGIVVLLEAPKADKALLGALARAGSQAVFVKLNGTKDEVARERAAFESFCRSLATQP